MLQRKIYLLHSKEGVHLIASNFKVVYEALKDIEDNVEYAHLKSYSWYCFYLDNNQDVAIPDRKGGHYTVSRRIVISKYVGHLAANMCTIPNFKKP